MKRQSMEWNHQSSPHMKQFKVQTSTHKVTVIIFRVHERMLLEEFLEVPQSILSGMC